MGTDRPSKTFVAGQVVGLIVVLGAGAVAAPSANWDMGLFALLLSFSVLSDLTATRVDKDLLISGSFLALVLSMVFLGGTPAMLIGLIATVRAWLRWREPGPLFVQNLFNFSLFPLVGGILFHAIISATGITDTDVSYYSLVFGIFLVALAINFMTAAIYARYISGTTVLTQVRTSLVPLLPSELMAAL